MAEGSSDPPEFNPDGTSHHKQHQHKSRRGRPRYNNDRNLSSSSYDPSPQNGNHHQGIQPLFSHNNSHYAEHHHPPHGEDTAGRRGRGRGRREGNRGSNGSSGPWWQRPGGDFVPYGGSNRYADGYQSGAHPMDGPNWRREDVNRNLEQTNEDRDVRSKKPRKFSQEQRRGEQSEKSANFKENNIAVEGPRSHAAKGENSSSDTRKKGQHTKTGSEFQRDDHQRKHSEVKRRQGPIKPPKQPAQEEVGSERVAIRQDDYDHGRSSHDSATIAGRGSGRHTVPLTRGGRRPNHQNHKAGQRSWDKMPKSKETQTGCLIEQLSEEKYECMVCCDVIRVMAPVWSCQSCYHVFHLNCIKKWARSPASQADDSTEGWRCPACQNVATKHPTSYTCFCGKVTNPEWQRSEIPHSCGDLCGKKRSGVDCNHPCNM